MTNGIPSDAFTRFRAAFEAMTKHNACTPQERADFYTGMLDQQRLLIDLANKDAALLDKAERVIRWLAKPEMVHDIDHCASRVGKEISHHERTVCIQYDSASRNWTMCVDNMQNTMFPCATLAEILIQIDAQILRQPATCNTNDGVREVLDNAN